MKYIIIVLGFSFLSACSGLPVKKCVAEAPQNVMSCAEKLKTDSGLDLRKCKPVDHGCLVEDPQ